MITNKKVLAVAAVLAATVLTGCGGDDNTKSSTTAPTTSLSSSPSPSDAAAADPAVTVSKGAEHEPTGNYVAVDVEGFPASKILTVEIALNDDYDWCAGASPCENTRTITTDAEGSGSLEQYWWNGTAGTVTVKVDGVEDSITW